MVEPSGCVTGLEVGRSGSMFRSWGILEVERGASGRTSSSAPTETERLLGTEEAGDVGYCCCGCGTVRVAEDKALCC